MERALTQADAGRRHQEPQVESGWSPASDWRDGLPVLSGSRVSLREVARVDARSLAAMVGVTDVTAVLSHVPSTVDGFTRFIDTSTRERADGRVACFAVIPSGCTQAVGFIHIHLRDADGGTAEWTFALSPQFWGVGVFPEAAGLAVEFVFGVLGARRLEARVATRNGRGNGALDKLGAVQEGLLHNALVLDGQRQDQVLWTILDEDWRCYRATTLTASHVH